MMTNLEYMSRAELILYILDLEDMIEDLEYQLKITKEKQSSKITKDFEDNKKMIADIFNSIKDFL